MAPFFATVKLNFSRKIHAPKSRVLAIIQNFEALTTLSPFITASVPQPKAPKPNTFEVTERNIFFGCIPISTTYPAICTVIGGEGVDVQESAALGTKITEKYRVKELDAQECEVLVEVDLTLFVLLKSYTVSTTKDAHEKEFDRLEEMVKQ
jgi:hypothetical protein